MIAKTVTGSDFTGALEYGAGLRADRTNKRLELLSVANVGSQEAHQIAAEMAAVASMSSRIQQPVWHTVLSWAPGEQVSREQKLKAAARYCELMGADLGRHQPCTSTRTRTTRTCTSTSTACRWTGVRPCAPTRTTPAT